MIFTTISWAGAGFTLSSTSSTRTSSISVLSRHFRFVADYPFRSFGRSISLTSWTTLEICFWGSERIPNRLFIVRRAFPQVGEWRAQSQYRRWTCHFSFSTPRQANLYFWLAFPSIGSHFRCYPRCRYSGRACYFSWAAVPFTTASLCCWLTCYLKRLVFSSNAASRNQLLIFYHSVFTDGFIFIHLSAS